MPIPVDRNTDHEADGGVRGVAPVPDVTSNAKRADHPHGPFASGDSLPEGREAGMCMWG